MMKRDWFIIRKILMGEPVAGVDFPLLCHNAELLRQRGWIEGHTGESFMMVKRKTYEGEEVAAKMADEGILYGVMLEFARKGITPWESILFRELDKALKKREESQ